MKIQTQARERAARAQREGHRQRHSARVGSIRSSGRAAAEDLRALSRPGTAAGVAAATAAAVDSATDVTATGGDGGASGGEGGGFSAWDGAPEAFLPISVGMVSMGSGAPTTASGWGAVAPQSGSFSLPAAIEVVSVRTPSSAGSPASATAAAAASSIASPGRGADIQAKGNNGSSRAGDGTGRHGARPNSGKGIIRSNSYGSSPLGSDNSGSGRKASATSVSPVGRSRAPSTARYGSALRAYRIWLCFGSQVAELVSIFLPHPEPAERGFRSGYEPLVFLFHAEPNHSRLCI